MPVAIVGTFAVMAALGFSLNNLSLFGLVLAIGIVVDDAIVVVENVERWLEQGLDAREATRQGDGRGDRPGHRRRARALRGVRAVRVHRGLTGQFFRQFAVTIAVSTLISAFNSLTLSPALAAILLKPRGRPARDPLTRLLDALPGLVLPAFNRGLRGRHDLYIRLVAGLLVRVSLLTLLVYGGLLVLDVLRIRPRAPTGFIPQQDKGYLLLNVQLPDSASMERTRRIMGRIEIDRPRHAGSRAHGGHLGPIADPERERGEPGLDVRHARGIRPAVRART